MAELDLIAEDLRRQRKTLDDLLDETTNRRGETSRLLQKIEELRRRSEAAQARYIEVSNEIEEASDDGPEPRPTT
ncbi:MAG: hypothetical protein M3Q69_08490 [Acidobacteriota bacterium]|nr:hypothetical protein [Acidobacteriota bacterium]